VKKKRLYLFQLIIYIGFAYLQTRLFYQKVSFHYFLPDFAFIIMLFFALQNGKTFGFWTGFIAGLIIHAFMLPDSVLGLYALIYTIIGYIVGNLKGRLIVDPLFLPLLYAFITLIIKYSILFLFSFLNSMPIEPFIWKELLINILFTLILAPIFYNLLRLIHLINPNERIKA